MKHTPTPWRIQPESGEYPDPYWIEKEGTEGLDYRRILGITDDWDEGWANAKFIVKACNAHDELLEACKLLIAKDAAMAEYFGDKWPLDLAPKNARKRGKQAIFRASLAPDDPETESYTDKEWDEIQFPD